MTPGEGLSCKKEFTIGLQRRGKEKGVFGKERSNGYRAKLSWTSWGGQKDGKVPHNSLPT